MSSWYPCITIESIGYVYLQEMLLYAKPVVVKLSKTWFESATPGIEFERHTPHPQPYLPKSDAACANSSMISSIQPYSYAYPAPSGLHFLSCSKL
jgi:hypothetical protein